MNTKLGFTHTEVYLSVESLLFASFRTAVVCPIIDVISDETFEYMAGSDMTYGGFNWKLNFRWYPVPQREMDRRKGDRTLPVRYRKKDFCLIFLEAKSGEYVTEFSLVQCLLRIKREEVKKRQVQTNVSFQLLIWAKNGFYL